MSTPCRPTTGLMRITSNTAFPRTPKPEKKQRSLYESGLSLKRIIGTTVNSPTAFDSLSSSRSFAYVAGASAVVVNFSGDDKSKYTQRFFRARPTALPLNAINATSFGPSTPTNTPNDGRNRAVAALRDSAVPYSPTTPHTSLDWGDSPSSKTWTSRERIKAATCVSMSRDGRFLAVGEVRKCCAEVLWSITDRYKDWIFSEGPYLFFAGYLFRHSFGHFK